MRWSPWTLILCDSEAMMSSMWQAMGCDSVGCAGSGEGVFAETRADTRERRNFSVHIAQTRLSGHILPTRHMVQAHDLLPTRLRILSRRVVLSSVRLCMHVMRGVILAVAASTIVCRSLILWPSGDEQMMRDRSAQDFSSAVNSTASGTPICYISLNLCRTSRILCTHTT